MDWKLTEIQISKINPTVKNPKTRDKAGFERLRKSLEKFGRVFDGIVNAVNKDGTYDLIDGNSRLEQIKGQKTGMYFVPDKRLTEKEYREFNSIFDVAKAGELDFEMVFEDLGQEFMDDWELDFEGGKEKKDLSDNIDLKHIIEVELNSEEDQGVGLGNFMIDTVAKHIILTGFRYVATTSSIAIANYRKKRKEWKCTRIGRHQNRGSKSQFKNFNQRITTSWEYIM